MNNEGDFMYVLGWFEFLSALENKFYFLRRTPGTFGELEI